MSTRSSPRDFQKTFIIGRDFVEVKILKKVKLALFELCRIVIKFRQMLFVIGRGFAENLILNKTKPALSLELYGIV